MKATISGVEDWSMVRLIPETEQELLILEGFAEGEFNGVSQYCVPRKMTVLFIRGQERKL